jgi:hypothetical protein
MLVEKPKCVLYETSKQIFPAHFVEHDIFNRTKEVKRIKSIMVEFLLLGEEPDDRRAST